MAEASVNLSSVNIHRNSMNPCQTGVSFARSHEKYQRDNASTAAAEQYPAYIAALCVVELVHDSFPE